MSYCKILYITIIYFIMTDYYNGKRVNSPPTLRYKFTYLNLRYPFEKNSSS